MNVLEYHFVEKSTLYCKLSDTTKKNSKSENFLDISTMQDEPRKFHFLHERVASHDRPTTAELKKL